MSSPLKRQEFRIKDISTEIVKLIQVFAILDGESVSETATKAFSAYIEKRGLAVDLHKIGKRS